MGAIARVCVLHVRYKTIVRDVVADMETLYAQLKYNVIEVDILRLRRTMM